MFDLPGVTTVGGEFVTNNGRGSGLGLFLSLADKIKRSIRQLCVDSND